MKRWYYYSNYNYIPSYLGTLLSQTERGRGQQRKRSRVERRRRERRRRTTKERMQRGRSLKPRRKNSPRMTAPLALMMKRQVSSLYNNNFTSCWIFCIRLSFTSFSFLLISEKQGQEETAKLRNRQRGAAAESRRNERVSFHTMTTSYQKPQSDDFILSEQPKIKKCLI